MLFLGCIRQVTVPICEAKRQNGLELVWYPCFLSLRVHFPLVALFWSISTSGKSVVRPVTVRLILGFFSVN